MRQRTFIGWALLLIGLFCLAPQSHALPNQDTNPELPSLVPPKNPRKFEVGIHYSRWTLDLVKSFFEEKLADKLGEELGDEVSANIRETHPALSQSQYEESLGFDSGGWNYGFEIRYYPQGEFGAFSLGLSFEKTRMSFTAEGVVNQIFTNGTSAQINALGFIELDPWTTNLSLRWDLKPSWVVSPYLVLGLGIGSLNGEISYEYQGVYKWAGPDQIVQDALTKTLKEAEEDLDFNLPNIFVLVQTSLGLRAEISPFLSLRGEVGFWDGFMVRAGITFIFYSP